MTAQDKAAAGSRGGRRRIQSPCRRCKRLHRNANGYCDEHAGLARQWSHTKKDQTTTQRGYGWRWQQLRKRVLERDGYLCQCEDCQQRPMPLLAHEVDHIIPKVEGGTDSPGNLQAINKDCHDKKSQAEAQRGRRPV